MGYAHLAHVVQVGAQQDSGLRLVVEPEQTRHGNGILRDPLAMAERVRVGGFDRPAPLPDHRQVRAFELRHLPAHVDQVDAGIQAAEHSVRGVEQAQRVLVALRHLKQHCQLTGGFGFVQHRPRAGRQRHCRAEPRLGERGAAHLSIHHAQHAIRFGLRAACSQLIVQGERRLGVLARVLEPLARHVHFGVMDETEALQMQVTGALGDHATLPEVAVRLVELLAVGTDHAQVVVGNSAPMLVTGTAERFEGPPVPCVRLVELALDIRQNPEVLLHARAQLAVLPTKLERLKERLARLAEGAGREIEPAQCVQRLRREHIVADGSRHTVAAVAQTAGQGRLVAMMPHHGETPEGLDQDRPLPARLGGVNRGLVALDRLGDTARALPAARLVQQVRGAMGRAAGDDAGVTRRWHNPRSVGADP